MNLEDQIARITIPQEFTRLCNTLLTAKYGEDFQVIDGTRSDEGNDGYIDSQNRIIAIFCPIKPERRTDNDYKQKIRSDLGKASRLKTTGKFNVENWTFITPRKLSNEVIAIMRAEGQSLGICASHQESTFLATVLYENPHLINAFPDLYLHTIDSKIDQLREIIQQDHISQKQPTPPLSETGQYKPDTKDNADYDRVTDLRTGPVSRDSITELQTILYQSTDPVVQINSILGLLDFWDPTQSSPDEMIQLCDTGIEISNRIGDDSLRPYLLGQKGFYISFTYSMLDMRTALQINADNAIGFQTITEAQRQDTINRLKYLENQFTKAFEEALQTAISRSDLRTAAAVLTNGHL